MDTNPRSIVRFACLPRSRWLLSLMDKSTRNCSLFCHWTVCLVRLLASPIKATLTLLVIESILDWHVHCHFPIIFLVSLVICLIQAKGSLGHLNFVEQSIVPANRRPPFILLCYFLNIIHWSPNIGSRLILMDVKLAVGLITTFFIFFIKV